jgi:hypothetical protein
MMLDALDDWVTDRFFSFFWEASMRRKVFASAAVVLTLAGVALAAETLKSGLQPGESAGFFEVKDCSGPNEGRSLCYR